MQLQTCAGGHSLSFHFDSDVECTVTVYTSARTLDQPACFKAEHSSDPQAFPAAMNQRFVQSGGDLLQLDKNVLEGTAYDSNRPELFPLVVVLSTDAPCEQGVACKQITFAEFALEDAGRKWAVRAIKQHLVVGSSEFEMQELYGVQPDRPGEDSGPEEGQECVICMEAARDTAVLPCRHLCMCGECAGTFRLRTTQCPVCRQRVVALLQLVGQDTESEVS